MTPMTPRDSFEAPRLALSAAVWVAFLGIPATAAAEITPSRDALAVAQAIVDRPSTITGASFVAIPPNNNPVAISTTPLAEFPTSGTSFVILTSGEATFAGLPNSAANTSGDDNGPILRGARDVTILKIDLDVPSDVSCLSIRYRFLSEEFPEFVGSQFNDAFIAELDQNTWDAGSATDPVISAPDNFAFDRQNNPISVNSIGDLSVSPESAVGTTYDAATRRLRASTPITPGPHSLFLTIFDQGDRIFDSAAFIDRLTLSNLSECTPGAAVDLTSLDPAEITQLGSGLASIPATRVFLPTKLSIDRVVYSHRQARSGRPFKLRVVVTDTRGFRVRNARVRLFDIPPGSIAGGSQKRTGVDGSASIRVRRARTPAFLYIRALRPDRPQSGTACDGICGDRLEEIK